MKLKIMQKKRSNLKPDYIDAWIVLSQVGKECWQNADALSYAQTALSIAPLDENLKKYVDAMKSGDSSNAAVPFPIFRSSFPFNS